jgi:polysaccharide export outer membrane protein
MKTVFFAVLAFVLSVTGAVAQDSYRIRPGDTLTIEVLEDSSLNRNVLITPGGSFSFPFAGSIIAQGFTTDQIAARLSGAIAGNFASPPNVFVSVRDVRSSALPGATSGAPVPDPTISVFFMGEVGDSGERELAPGTTFLQALARAGGLTNFAAERRIQLRRTDPVTLNETVVTINYRALQRGARMSQNIVLIDGDVILVPERGLFE